TLVAPAKLVASVRKRMNDARAVRSRQPNCFRENFLGRKWWGDQNFKSFGPGGKPPLASARARPATVRSQPENPTRALRVSLWIQRSRFANILKLQSYLNFAEEK